MHFSTRGGSPNQVVSSKLPLSMGFLIFASSLTDPSQPAPRYRAVQLRVRVDGKRQFKMELQNKGIGCIIQMTESAIIAA